MAADQPLDTTIGVVTPENIAFEYQLAGPFRRLPAFVIDVFVVIGINIGLGFLLGLIAFLLTTTVTAILEVLGVGLFIAATLFVAWFYGTLMEAHFNGRTVGKWICGLRVIEIDGRAVTPRSALLRNLVRVADFFPIAFTSVGMEFGALVWLVPLGMLGLPTGMVGLITMMMTRRLQRLGDLAAGTMVVVDERKWQLPVAKVDDPRVPALASFIPADYRVTRRMSRTLATYVERRAFLTPGRRTEVARALADPLGELFEFRKDIDPDLLLYALYYQTFLKDSSAPLPDVGNLSNYSPLARDAHRLNQSPPAVNPPPAVNSPAVPQAVGSPAVVEPAAIPSSRPASSQAGSASSVWESTGKPNTMSQPPTGPSMNREDQP
ncbi:RDD family protein [Stieleria bergensis]|uniref:RDD family protein n=1 Tax=Stieleria bergensis TaxID=2528025 RepID=A0A517SXB2_9BACT|nr:RDD family protein [Planctomycetes bacterium SV_7m_r]